MYKLYQVIWKCKISPWPWWMMVFIYGTINIYYCTQYLSNVHTVVHRVKNILQAGLKLLNVARNIRAVKGLGAGAAFILWMFCMIEGIKQWNIAKMRLHLRDSCFVNVVKYTTFFQNVLDTRVVPLDSENWGEYIFLP